MELTGKCKKEFKKWQNDCNWFEDLNIYNENYTNIEIFYTLTPSMQYGVLEDYFDSVGIRISINQHDGTYWYDIQSPFFECDEVKTRLKARNAAIEKANELRNKQLNDTIWN
jgi:hypothetical protein